MWRYLSEVLAGATLFLLGMTIRSWQHDDPYHQCTCYWRGWNESADDLG